MLNFEEVKYFAMLDKQRQDHCIFVAGFLGQEYKALPCVQTLIKAGLLHDIGYCTGQAYAHSLLGYEILSKIEPNPIYGKVCLYHSGSQLILSENQEFSSKVTENPLSIVEQSIVNLVSYADFHVSHTGNIVSAERRIASIGERYGKDSIQYISAVEYAKDLDKREFESCCFLYKSRFKGEIL